MTRRMPRPEDVSRDHIDAAVMGFLKGEKEADWTEVSLVTLAPSRGDSCGPPGKPGTIPDRERGTLSPAPRPSKAPRRILTCKPQVAFMRRRSSTAGYERSSESSAGEAPTRRGLDVRGAVLRLRGEAPHGFAFHHTTLAWVEIVSPGLRVTQCPIGNITQDAGRGSGTRSMSSGSGGAAKSRT